MSSKPNWAPLQCSRSEQCAHLAFLGMILPTELVLFKEFSVLSAGSCVYGSKKKMRPVDSLVI